VNSIRKTIDNGQLAFVKSGKLQPVHVTSRFYSFREKRIEFPRQQEQDVKEMLKRNILINCTSDTVLRFLPPYILERAHVDAAIAALDEIFTEHAAGQAATASAGGQQRG